MRLFLCFLLAQTIVFTASFNLMEFAHYFDYLPYRQEGLTAFEDFRTAPTAPSALRNRKMEVGSLLDSGVAVEEVLESPVWPTKWPCAAQAHRGCAEVHVYA